MTNRSQKLALALFVLCFSVPALGIAAPDLAMQQQLEQELRAIEAQISQLKQQLATTKGEKKTLASKIQRLKKEQDRLRLQIQATKLQIESLQSKMNKLEQAIALNKAKSERLKIELAELLRLMHQKSREPIIYRLITDEGGLGTLFIELKNYEYTSVTIRNLVEESTAIRKELLAQQEAYEHEQDNARQLLSIASVQQTTLTGKLQEQSRLLQQTQGLEETYQNLLKDSKKLAAEIKSRIYELLGVSTQITFGQALSIAQWVEAQTDVPAAFLLAILTQESNLGKNVGMCNRPGDPLEKSWTVVMKPERDHEPFLKITEELGRDPDITPVSCPMIRNGKQIGWGGAMGPAQFIPSTWMGYKNKVSALTGKAPADPWDIRDAFAAAALLLKANGASNTRDGQWKAAMRYFSGGTNPMYRFYGDSVLELTEKYEEDIKALEQ